MSFRTQPVGWAERSDAQQLPDHKRMMLGFTIPPFTPTYNLQPVALTSVGALFVPTFVLSSTKIINNRVGAQTLRTYGKHLYDTGQKVHFARTSPLAA